jgi:hypothetical protein
LRQLDEHKDYSAGVKFFFYSDNGNHRIYIPYYIWQSGKCKAIKRIFINTIEYEGRDYKITAEFPDQPYINHNGASVIIMRNYVFDVQLVVTNSPTVNLENNISISGDAKNVIINQSNESNITIHKLQEFMDDHRNELDTVDINTIKDFIIDYRAGKTTKSRINKIIGIIANYATVIDGATGIISLLSQLL